MSTDSTVGDGPPSDRVRLRRGAHNAVYDRQANLATLDSALIAHLGVQTPSGPSVIPMAFGRDDRSIYLHGAAANAALRAAIGAEVCVTVTVVDGIIIGRSPFHNSMQYRSVVVRGRAEQVPDDAKADALRRVSDHVVATWDAGRRPTADELRRTLVIAVPLREMSGKHRTGGPVDEPGDLVGPHWGGSVPLHSAWGEPVPADDLAQGREPPGAVRALGGRSR